MTLLARPLRSLMREFCFQEETSAIMKHFSQSLLLPLPADGSSLGPDVIPVTDPEIIASVMAAHAQT